MRLLKDEQKSILRVEAFRVNDSDKHASGVVYTQKKYLEMWLRLHKYGTYYFAPCQNRTQSSCMHENTCKAL